MLWLQASQSYMRAQNTVALHLQSGEMESYAPFLLYPFSLPSSIASWNLAYSFSLVSQLRLNAIFIFHLLIVHVVFYNLLVEIYLAPQFEPLPFFSSLLFCAAFYPNRTLAGVSCPRVCWSFILWFVPVSICASKYCHLMTLLHLLFEATACLHWRSLHFLHHLLPIYSLKLLISRYQIFVFVTSNNAWALLRAEIDHNGHWTIIYGCWTLLRVCHWHQTMQEGRCT